MVMNSSKPPPTLPSAKYQVVLVGEERDQAICQRQGVITAKACRHVIVSRGWINPIQMIVVIITRRDIVEAGSVGIRVTGSLVKERVYVAKAEIAHPQ